MIRCDEPMREKKEAATALIQDLAAWQCTGDCYRCICGLRKNRDGTWSHNNTQSKLIDMLEGNNNE